MICQMSCIVSPPAHQEEGGKKEIPGNKRQSASKPRRGVRPGPTTILQAKGAAFSHPLVAGGLTTETLKWLADLSAVGGGRTRRCAPTIQRRLTGTRFEKVLQYVLVSQA